MSLPSEDDVRDCLARLAPALVKTVREGWRAWRESAQSGRWRCKRSRANFVWEEIIDRAHTRFGSEPGVVIVTSSETFSFIVDDVVLFRFKKADSEGLSANVPTQLALAFHDHEQNLFGIPELQRVEVVYQLNNLETEISDILVVARDASQIAWSYSLVVGEEGVMPLPIPAPELPGDAAKRPGSSANRRRRRRASAAWVTWRVSSTPTCSE